MIPYSDPEAPEHRFPFVNLALIAANFAVFAWELHEQAAGQLNHFYFAYSVVPCELFGRCAAEPGAPHPVLLTIFTSMFLHAGWLHILGNMIFLWVFGDNVENAMGHLRYLVFYLCCGVAAGLTQSAVAAGSHVPSLGASGAIAGVLAAYLVLMPTAVIGVLLFIFVIPLPIRLYAWILIGFWFVEQLLNGFATLGPSAQTGGVAFFAHIGGFVCGFLLVWVFRQPHRTEAVRRRHQQIHGRPAANAWPPRAG